MVMGKKSNYFLWATKRDLHKSRRLSGKADEYVEDFISSSPSLSVEAIIWIRYKT